MAHSAKFWDKIAQKYSKQPIADEETYKKKLEISRSYFTPESELLEIGCGTGSTALLHAPFVKHVEAVDISENMIAIAQEKATAVENVTFHTVDSDDLDIAPESKDAVLALSFLHLIEDKDAMIREVYKILKPGGVFITSTACLGDFMVLFKLIIPVGMFFGLFPLVKIFTSVELKQSFTSTGFEILHDWSPGKNKGQFIVLRKLDS